MDLTSAGDATLYGGPGTFSPGKFEKLDCLRLHFVLSEGSMLQNEASKSE